MELKDIIKILLRRKLFILKIFGAFFLTVIIGTLLITPWYDSTAKVLLRRSSASSSLLSSIGLQSGTSVQSSISETDRADYLGLATVAPVAEEVISELQITRERIRHKLIKTIPFLKSILSLFGKDIGASERAMTAETLLDAALLSYIFPRPYAKVEQYEETDILEITGMSPDPEQAMNIANAMASVFISQELKRVREDYTGAKEFIDKNIEKAKIEYIETLKDIELFKKKEKTVNLDTETTNILQDISDLKKSWRDNDLTMSKIKSSIAAVENRLKSVPKYQKATEKVKQNDMIRDIKLTLTNLYLDFATTKTKYTKNHPNVIDIENKIAQTKELLQKEIEKIFGEETTGIDPLYEFLIEKLAGYYADLAGFESMDNTFPKIIKRYESELMKLPKKVFAYSQLQLALTVTQDIYDNLLKYQYQIGIAESVALSNIYIVENAIRPDFIGSKHKSPSLLLNVIIAIFIGIPLSIGAALFIEYLDDTIKTAEDVKAFTDLPFLGSIFRIKSKELKLIDTLDSKSPLRETFRSLRNSIRFASLDKQLKSFVVTSSVIGEGKTFFTSNIAISLVTEGKKILIIDGDLRRPSLHSQFQKSNEKGLTNYLAGDVDIADIQVQTHIDGLTIIPTGPIPPDPVRIVESNKMHYFISDMLGKYDIVIIDAPPVIPVTDAIVFGHYVDGVVVVIESGRVSKTMFSDTTENIKKANINILGIVLNKVTDYRAAYYYYSGYYYSKGDNI